jgi:hypothetical protein
MPLGSFVCELLQMGAALRISWSGVRTDLLLY